ncbi:MAG: prolipoprotein diacylglyceryl transferase [Deltaproteobacteria bacterium]|nr:prolipoprotein diacylglyceryl transferase [Candidatus Anaeroferrophillus wilburensis]MBN2890194.1 prolipoprotein diacylglyceryl transferase [Deltaproteobacteria bacterium]
MTAIMFVATLAGLLTVIFWWSFTHLTRERWQMLAVIPVRRRPDGQWTGVNLTYYGLLSANAYLLAAALVLVMFGSLGINLQPAVMLVAIMLAVCIPAASIMARLVERKGATLTVAGAVFVGNLVLPFLVMLLNRFLWAGSWMTPLAVMPIMAAVAVAYAVGEGAGRLACISFGCCYGRPLVHCSPWCRFLFAKFNFVFTGKTKKVAYEACLDGTSLIPIQGVTAIINCGAGLVGLWFFLMGHYGLTFLLVVVVTQGWRCFSEFMRADYRGGGRWSAYQVMAILTIFYDIGMAWLLPASVAGIPDLPTGLTSLWQPLAIFMLQAIWLLTLFHTGLSRVTGASLLFHLKEEKV